MHVAGTSELDVLSLGEFGVEVLVRHVHVRVTVMVAGDDKTAAEHLDVLETTFPVVSSAIILRVYRLAPKHDKLGYAASAELCLSS